MDGKLSFFKYTLNVSIRQVFNKRTVVLAVLLTIFMDIYIAPIRGFSRDAGYPVSPWVFPFLANDMYFLVITVLSLIYFYSNVPFMQKSGIYFVMRTGRIRWALSQVLSVILGGFTFVCGILGISICILFPVIKFTTGWDKVFYTLALTDMGNNYSMHFSVSYEIIKRFKPLQAVGLLLIIGGLLFSMIGNIMFCLSIYFNRTVAIIAAMILTVMTVMQENMYLFKRMLWISPVSWMRLDKFLDMTKLSINPTLAYSIAVLAAVNLISIALILYRAKSLDFQWNMEDA